eukprot:2753200-Rhodomonas_salina.4
MLAQAPSLLPSLPSPPPSFTSRDHGTCSIPSTCPSFPSPSLRHPEVPVLSLPHKYLTAHTPCEEGMRARRLCKEPVPPSVMAARRWHAP